MCNLAINVHLLLHFQSMYSTKNSEFLITPYMRVDAYMYTCITFYFHFAELNEMYALMLSGGITLLTFSLFGRISSGFHRGSASLMDLLL